MTSLYNMESLIFHIKACKKLHHSPSPLKFRLTNRVYKQHTSYRNQLQQHQLWYCNPKYISVGYMLWKYKIIVLVILKWHKTVQNIFLERYSYFEYWNQEAYVNREIRNSIDFWFHGRHFYEDIIKIST